MGGFIIGAEDARNRCGRVVHDDGSKVTWICRVCHKLVCRLCTLTDPTWREVLDKTLCSEDCRTVFIAESDLCGIKVEDDVRRQKAVRTWITTYFGVWDTH